VNAITGPSTYVTMLIALLFGIWIGIAALRSPSSAQIAGGCRRHGGVASGTFPVVLSPLIVVCKDGKVWQP
jgi:hypothetical protein